MKSNSARIDRGASLAMFMMIASGAISLWAQDPAERFNERLRAGAEVGVVLPQTQSADGKIAVLYTARIASADRAAWPDLFDDVEVAMTDADAEGMIQENWIVSLPDRRRLALLESEVDGVVPFYPGQRRTDFSAIWTRDESGSRVGLAGYHGYWESLDVQLVDLRAEAAGSSSILASLDSAAQTFLRTQPEFPEDSGYHLTYSFVAPDENAPGLRPGESVDLRVRVTAQVPKDDETPSIEGMLTLRVAGGGEQPLEANVVKVGGAKEAQERSEAEGDEAPVTGASASAPTTRSEFAAFRKELNAQSKGDAWKTVQVSLPVSEGRARHYVQGWFEGYDLKMMMHVDSANETDETLTLYYYREGMLTSAFELRAGSDTQMSDVGEATETYEFIHEKLAFWTRTPAEGGDGSVDPSDPGFESAGEAVRARSIEYSQPLFEKIGAD